MRMPIKVIGKSRMGRPHGDDAFKQMLMMLMII